MAESTADTRILVPLDNSTEARRALQPALRLARPLNCPIELVTVYDPVNGRWARDLDDVAEHLAYDHVEVALVGAGWPGHILAEMAAEQPGTLLCMTALHRDELDRLVLGSVSAHLVRTSPAPILFVGPGYEPSGLPQRYRRLLVCLDGSSRADAAVNVATAWAHRFQIELELVHVAAPTDSPAHRDSIGTRLTDTANTLAADNIRATATLLTGENPAESITQLLHSRTATLALTATHGRTGLGRLLLGSVTAELLTRSPNPVLVTRNT